MDIPRVGNNVETALITVRKRKDIFDHGLRYAQMLLAHDTVNVENQILVVRSRKAIEFQSWAYRQSFLFRTVWSRTKMWIYIITGRSSSNETWEVGFVAKSIVYGNILGNSNTKPSPTRNIPQYFCGSLCSFRRGHACQEY